MRNVRRIIPWDTVWNTTRYLVPKMVIGAYVGDRARHYYGLHVKNARKGAPPREYRHTPMTRRETCIGGAVFVGVGVAMGAVGLGLTHGLGTHLGAQVVIPMLIGDRIYRQILSSTLPPTK